MPPFTNPARFTVPCVFSFLRQDEKLPAGIYERRTTRTELQEAFPSHVVDECLGHSSKVAEDHYLQVTNDHWLAGASNPTGGPIGGPISVKTEPLGDITENKKHDKRRVMMVADIYSKTIEYPQQDSNLQPSA